MTTPVRRRALMVQPSINPPGGGNAVACWMLEALKSDHDITLLTREEPDVARANLVFGTQLSSADLRVMMAEPDGFGPMTTMSGIARLALLKDHQLLRQAREMAADFDVILTANNESDLGRRGIQYVHFPKLITARPDGNLRWYQGPIAVGVYQAACALITGFTPARMRANLTLVNSDWTGQLIRERHGIEPITLFPPAAGAFPPVAWGNRRLAFACVGRIAPGKRIEQVIALMAQLRQRHPDIVLHVAGNADDQSYLAHIKVLAACHSEWLQLHVDMPREQLVHLMTECRFGIHGMHNEHFGMAIAELVRAGTIPFAPHSGGPVEILGGDRRLLYDNDDDAIAKIRRVIEDDGLAAELRGALAARADRFSSDRFVHDFRQLVDDFTTQSARPSP